jgi:hypothetical protein
MTADITFRSKMIHLSEGEIHLVSIEILRYLANLKNTVSVHEAVWREDVEDTCRQNLAGRGFGCSDLDLHKHAATDFGLKLMQNLLRGVIVQYDAESKISKSVLNSFCSQATAYTDDVSVDIAKESFRRILELLKET